jgi:hypothetical protein
VIAYRIRFLLGLADLSLSESKSHQSPIRI